MLDSLLDAATVSPWVHLAILAFAALDAVFPIMPSEAAVISAGALAGSGELNLALVVAAAAAGALAGDNGAFGLGRLMGPRVSRESRAAPGPRGGEPEPRRSSTPTLPR